MLRGEITPRICSVRRNGINSGIAKLTPLSNAIPKSIPRTSPSFLSSKKFSRCLSPIPRIYEAIQNEAYDFINQVQIFKNASTVKHKFYNPLFSKSWGKIFLCKSNASFTFPGGKHKARVLYS